MTELDLVTAIVRLTHQVDRSTAVLIEAIEQNTARLDQALTAVEKCLGGKK